MVSESVLKKYAELTVKMGTNVQSGQPVVITCGTEQAYFAREVVEEAYKAGASYVRVLWNDELVTKISYQYAAVEQLETIPQWFIDQYDYYVEQGVALIHIISDTPGLMKDADPLKLQRAAIASSNALKNYRQYSMGNKGQWTIVAVSNPNWAVKVFPTESAEVANQKLWDAILSAARVSESNNPIQEWEEHNKRLSSINQMMNEFNFKSLHFKNSLGTDLTVGLVENHVWAGGSEKTTKGVEFNPNIPTEECFTMPSKLEVNGTVVATTPLNYQGKLINGFSFEFKDGKVVKHHADEYEDVLTNMLNMDEGSRYLGEVALISYDSPIQQSGILFLNTLFDENASCHLALGRAYPMNLKGGTSMSEEELEKHGYNTSNIHVDFMFGSRDMEIVGTKQDGTTVQVFENGNFVI